jgi:uncharacterized protein (DUF1330 family)
MPAYIIARVDVRDPQRYREYTARTPRAVARFGGRFIVRGGEVTTLEGQAETRRIVVVEFPTFEKAKAFYADAGYSDVKKYREGAGDAQFILVDGYPDAAWQKALAESL